MTFSSSTIELSGCRIALRRGGKGIPVLYLHGTDGLEDWPTTLDSLAARYDVIAPDLPGFGGSDGPDWLDDISDVAYLCLDLLERLGLPSVHVVGHSLGGWVALEMAVRSTQRIRSVTLIAAAGIHVKGSSKTDIFIIDPDEQARMSYVDAQMAEAAATRAAAEKYQDVMIRNRLASARLGWNPRFFNPRLERWLHRVRVPVHIIWGDRDRIIPPVYAEAFRSLLPSATLTMIRDAGHLPHVERTDATLVAMQDFMAEHGKGLPS